MGHVSPSQLTLSCQLNNIEPVEPSDTLLQRIKERRDLDTMKLGVSEKIAALFPQGLLEDHVHFLVQVPSTSEPVVMSLTIANQLSCSAPRLTFAASPGHGSRKVRPNPTPHAPLGNCGS